MDNLFCVVVSRALTSGSGVALALLLGASGPLIGVAISASLLPPVVNCVSKFWNRKYRFGRHIATVHTTNLVHKKKKKKFRSTLCTVFDFCFGCFSMFRKFRLMMSYLPQMNHFLEVHCHEMNHRRCHYGKLNNPIFGIDTLASQQIVLVAEQFKLIFGLMQNREYIIVEFGANRGKSCAAVECRGIGLLMKMVHYVNNGITDVSLSLRWIFCCCRFHRHRRQQQRIAYLFTNFIISPINRIVNDLARNHWFIRNDDSIEISI